MVTLLVNSPARNTPQIRWCVCHISAFVSDRCQEWLLSPLLSDCLLSHSLVPLSLPHLPPPPLPRLSLSHVRRFEEAFSTVDPHRPGHITLTDLATFLYRLWR
jgi:hypothetical protein